MQKKPKKKGFTIIEIIVAVGIITLIVSMSYGSYLATSKSTPKCKEKNGRGAGRERV